MKSNSVKKGESMAREMRDHFPSMTLFFTAGVISKTRVDLRRTSEFDDVMLNVPLLLHKCMRPAQSFM